MFKKDQAEFAKGPPRFFGHPPQPGAHPVAWRVRRRLLRLMQPGTRAESAWGCWAHCRPQGWSDRADDARPPQIVPATFPFEPGFRRAGRAEQALPANEALRAARLIHYIDREALRLRFLLETHNHSYDVSGRPREGLIQG